MTAKRKEITVGPTTTIRIGREMHEWMRFAALQTGITLTDIVTALAYGLIPEPTTNKDDYQHLVQMVRELNDHMQERTE